MRASSKIELSLPANDLWRVGTKFGQGLTSSYDSVSPDLILVAGARFELATFGLCLLLQLSLHHPPTIFGGWIWSLDYIFPPFLLSQESMGGLPFSLYTFPSTPVRFDLVVFSHHRSGLGSVLPDDFKLSRLGLHRI